jgi:hypothetical protein
MTITHTFAAPPPAPKSAPKTAAKRPEKRVERKPEKKAEEPRRKTPGDYWREFRRNIGL